ncbi:hypothetical protein HU200_016842 [Digitaria exilis]|uniref:Uncharacterized protein n=1 Tax=Digitaria exilis TaxID=1010633 RepID=A0A835F7U7_9POAL|nr:hypothetical protein HU200_016842 [Digitaria exilis]
MPAPRPKRIVKPNTRITGPEWEEKTDLVLVGSGGGGERKLDFAGEFLNPNPSQLLHYRDNWYQSHDPRNPTLAILDPLHPHHTRFQARAKFMAPTADPLVAVLAKLEELGKKVDRTNLKTDETNRRIEEMQASIGLLREEQSTVKEWKPEFEGKIAELQGSVFELKTKVDLFIHELPRPGLNSDKEVKVEAPVSAHLEATASAEASGQFGHREEILNRRAGAGVAITPVPPPVKGANKSREFWRRGFQEQGETRRTTGKEGRARPKRIEEKTDLVHVGSGGGSERELDFAGEFLNPNPSQLLHYHDMQSTALPLFTVWSMVFRGMVHALRTICAEEGIWALWKGLLPSAEIGEDLYRRRAGQQAARLHLDSCFRVGRAPPLLNDFVELDPAHHLFLSLSFLFSLSATRPKPLGPTYRRHPSLCACLSSLSDALGPLLSFLFFLPTAPRARAARVLRATCAERTTAAAAGPFQPRLACSSRALRGPQPPTPLGTLAFHAVRCAPRVPPPPYKIPWPPPIETLGLNWRFPPSRRRHQWKRRRVKRRGRRKGGGHRDEEEHLAVKPQGRGDTDRKLPHPDQYHDTKPACFTSPLHRRSPGFAWICFKPLGEPKHGLSFLSRRRAPPRSFPILSDLFMQEPRLAAFPLYEASRRSAAKPLRHGVGTPVRRRGRAAAVDSHSSHLPLDARTRIGRSNARAAPLAGSAFTQGAHTHPRMNGHTALAARDLEAAAPDPLAALGVGPRQAWAALGPWPPSRPDLTLGAHLPGPLTRDSQPLTAGAHILTWPTADVIAWCPLLTSS